MLLTLCFATTAFAQEKKEGKGLLGVAKKVMNFIDTMAVSNIDRTYIDVPKRPWQVIVKSVVNQGDMQMKSTIDGSKYFVGTEGEINWSPQIKTKPSAAVGLWAGYRGYGIGYTKNVAGDEGFYFVLTAMGGRYGANLRFHNFKTSTPHIKMSGYMPEWVEMDYDMDVASPIRVKTVLADVYYMFNGKHFSYSAAYDQSAFQLRSAGSLIVGATYYYSSVNYAADANADFILLMGDVGKAQQWQGSIGVGYAYNYVPRRNWLVSFLAMPTVSVVNKLKAQLYDSNYKDWAMDDELHTDYDTEDFVLRKAGTISHNSNVQVNADVRLAVSYNFHPFFAAAYGTFTRVGYSNGNNSGKLQSWYVNSSIGIRF
ncbi:MAG: DUF4421 family protein [Prevotella sp.]